MMATIHVCHDCPEVYGATSIAVTHERLTKHTTEKMVLVRRRRRANRGHEFQWSTDWLPEPERVG